MIPLIVSLKNFLSYGSHTQTINLEPYHLICLSGKNGHGKSALLDAITWVLWGQARKIFGSSTKGDQNLVRLGQSHMMVSLDFSSNGMTYRVRREYVVTQSKAVSHLDFGILDPTSQKYHSLTDKTIRITQEKITRAVGLEFESFINSVFLRQGQSNEFSKKAPRDRKEILATILGLDRFELMRRKASEYSRLLTQEYDMLVKNVEREQSELSQKNTLHKELELVSTTLDQYTHQQTLQEAALLALEEKRKKLQEQASLVHELKRTLEQYALQELNFLAQLREKVSLWRTVLYQTRKMYSNTDMVNELKELEQKILTIQTTLHANRTYQEEHKTLSIAFQNRLILLIEQHSQLMQKRAQMKSIAEAQKNSLEEQKNALLVTLHNHTAESKQLEKDKALLNQQSEALDKKLQDMCEEEKRFERRKQFYHKFVAHYSFLLKKLEELVLQKKAVEQDIPLCLQCNQTLQDSYVADKTHQDIHIYTHQKKRLEKILIHLKEILRTDHQTLLVYRHYQQEYATLKSKLQDLHLQQEKSTKYCEELSQNCITLENKLQETIAVVQKMNQESEPTLEMVKKNDPTYGKLNEQLKALEPHLQKTHELEQTYQQLMQRRITLTASIQHYHELAHNISQQDQRKKEIHHIIDEIRAVRIQQMQVKKEFECYAPLEKEIAAHEHEYEKTSSALKTIMSQKEHVLHRKGALEFQVTALQQKEEALASWRQKSITLENDKNDFTVLSHALSKDGIQALLIEEAIPEIEQEANTLLSLLSDNQAQLSIESLRDLKNGGVKETLDINISDSLGIRPYELFSGGEAFRIDFALRIAISKLLARRAGTSLQTLIIDEGFGSQDEEGLAHIMDALHKIQSHFAKIIVVSHLSSMKDQFPVHLIVQKMPHGSTISVFEQG